MNKNIAQLEDDYGVSPESLADAAGSLLPPIGTTDYGKYLKADDVTGKLKWSIVESGTEFFECTLTAQLDTSFNVAGFSINKTYAEISAAIVSGIPTLVKIMNKPFWTDAVESGYTFAYRAYSATANSTGIIMRVTGVDTGAYEVFLSSADVITFEKITEKKDVVIIPLTSQYTNSDYKWSDVLALLGSGVIVAFSVYANSQEVDGKLYFPVKYFKSTYSNYMSCRFVCVEDSIINTLSNDQAYMNNTISFQSPIQTVLNDPVDKIKLVESNGALVPENNSVYPYMVDGYSRFYMNYYVSGVGTTIKAFTLVSVQSSGLSSMDIVIKDNNTGDLYRSTNYNILSFTPYTP